MNKGLALVAGGIFGAFLGVAIPVGGAFIYVWTGGDPTAAGAFSFFPIFLVPTLSIIFAIVGFTAAWKKE